MVTGARADYGLLEPVMRAIDAHRKLRLSVVVAGLHLVQRTDRDVAFPIAARVPMQRAGDSGFAADVRAMARGVAGFGGVFARLKPDFVLVLGDRVEAFAAATAASLGGVRVAHVHGGDRAEGVADEAMRHAITKLAHVHLAATKTSARRITRMGESPGAVFRVGSPSIDGLRGVTPLFGAPPIVLVQHPIGATDAQEERWARQTLAAARATKLDVFIGGPNRDAGSRGVRRGLGLQRGAGHLPRRDFARLLAGARLIVGNSSAGLIEAAALRVPCVNVGPRQHGREKPRNVVDCDYGRDHVRRAIERALKLDLRRMAHPYGDGRAGERIAHVLATVDVPWRKRCAY